MPGLLDEPHVALNSDLSIVIRSLLKDAGVAAVQIVGNPGSGKTSLLDETLGQLKGRLRVGVAICHPSAQRDANLLSRHGGLVLHSSEGMANCETVFEMIRPVDLSPLDLLLIESAGPDEADIGQTARV